MKEAQQKIYTDVTHESSEEDLSESIGDCDDDLSGCAGDFHDGSDVDDDNNGHFSSEGDEYEGGEGPVYDYSDSDKSYVPEESDESDEDDNDQGDSPICYSRRSGKERKEVDEIGRAHVWTPVTPIARMPSSAWKKKNNKQ